MGPESSNRPAEPDGSAPDRIRSHGGGTRQPREP